MIILFNKSLINTTTKTVSTDKKEISSQLATKPLLAIAPKFIVYGR